MKKAFLFLLAGFLLSEDLPAQFSRYVIQLKDKAATTHTLNSPSAYLSPRSIERRTRYNIPVDSTDLPVPASYLSQIRNVPGVELLNVSRWLNAVAIRVTDPGALTTINGLPFVLSAKPVAARPTTSDQKFSDTQKAIPAMAGKPQGFQSNYFNYGSGSLAEIQLHNAAFLHNIGLRGQGMQIAMLDGGYFNYTSLDAFDSVNTNGQVLSTWDFVDNHASVTEDHPHGMQCFSIIAANIPGQFIGKAPKASFHLFKTEDVTAEYPIEEFNWACGAERADSAGADIISSSLGYGYLFNDPVADYPYSDLNGDITMSARAADYAAKKGILVFNSAGNSGTDYWKMITTPADGDSVVAVASVNTLGQVAANSSYGPSADGQVKPDVASVGVNALIQFANNTVGVGSGTSFACPNMAGISTCLWQGFPEVNNMRIVRALKESASIASNPNDRVGYGIPDMKKAFGALLSEFATSSATIDNCIATLSWTSKDVSAMKYEIERKTPNDAAYIKVGERSPVAGNLLATHDYEFTNALGNVPAGTVSYRIRQVIDTSAAGFSAVYIDTATFVTTATCTATSTADPDLAGTLVTVSPNPVHGNAALIVETTYAIPNMPVAIFDMTGRLMMQMKLTKPAGKIIIELPVSRLATGKYIIKVNKDHQLIGKTEMLKL